MGYITKAFKHSSFYLISNIMVVIAGFISMPLFTRMLTVTEYGLYTSIGVTLSFLLAFSKLGIQHAAVRFYSDFKENKDGKDVSSYFSTMIIGSAVLNIPINLLVLSVSYLVLYKHETELSLSIFILIFVIVVIDSIHSVMMLILIAQEKSLLYSVINILKRYGYVILAFISSFFFTNKLYGIYWGCLISNGLLFFILFYRWILQGKIRLRFIDLSILKEAIRYGFPLVMFELSTIILCMGDRYLIQYYMGVEHVGIYSVGYTIADMSQSILSFPLRLTVMPMYLRIWNEDGQEKTVKFLSQILNYYLLFGIPLIIGVSWFGKEIITLFATSKFQGASVIIPYVVFPLVIYGALPIYGASLYIHKKTNVLMYITLSSSILNIILNIILIPKLGLLGAAVATLVAYLGLTCLVVVNSYKHIRFKVNVIPILKYLVISISSVIVVSNFARILSDFILVKIFLVIILYCTGVFLIDRSIRERVLLYMIRYNNLLKST